MPEKYPPPVPPTDQSRGEAEQRGKPPSRAVKAGPVDPADYPPLAAEEPRDGDATADWLAHLAAGRIQIR